MTSAKPNSSFPVDGENVPIYNSKDHANWIIVFEAFISTKDAKAQRCMIGDKPIDYTAGKSKPVKVDYESVPVQFEKVGRICY